MMLPLPNEPKRSADRVPGAIAPAERIRAHPRWVTSLRTRRTNLCLRDSAMAAQRTAPSVGGPQGLRVTSEGTNAFFEGGVGGSEQITGERHPCHPELGELG